MSIGDRILPGTTQYSGDVTRAIVWLWPCLVSLLLLWSSVDTDQMFRPTLPRRDQKIFSEEKILHRFNS